MHRAITNTRTTTAAATNRPTNDGLELVDSAIDSQTMDADAPAEAAAAAAVGGQVKTRRSIMHYGGCRGCWPALCPRQYKPYRQCTVHMYAKNAVPRSAPELMSCPCLHDTSY